MFASVIVNVPASNVDKIFEYSVPSYLEQFISVGSRIKIPFGDGNRITYGFIIDLHEKQMFEGNVKEIEEIPDLKPIINEEQFALADFLKKTTISPMVRILNTMIPAALRMRTSKYLKINQLNGLDAELIDLFNGEEVIKLTKNHLEYSYKIKKAINNGWRC